MTKDAFYSIHPIINLLYFISVMTFLMLIMHPATVAISIVGVATKGLYFEYFPGIKHNSQGTVFYITVIAYGLLCNIPIILNVKEELSWKRIQSRI